MFVDFVGYFTSEKRHFWHFWIFSRYLLPKRHFLAFWNFGIFCMIWPKNIVKSFKAQIGRKIVFGYFPWAGDTTSRLPGRLRVKNDESCDFGFFRPFLWIWEPKNNQKISQNRARMAPLPPKIYLPMSKIYI